MKLLGPTVLVVSHAQQYWCFMSYEQDFKFEIQQSQVQLSAALRDRQINALARNCAQLRHNPMSGLKERLLGVLAGLMSRSAFPLSFRRRMRFARSMNKRDPQRCLAVTGDVILTGAGSGGPTPQEYQRWIMEVEPTPAPENTTAQVTIFVLMSVAETAAFPAMRDTLASLEAQSHLRWRVGIIAPPEIQVDLPPPTSNQRYIPSAQIAMEVIRHEEYVLVLHPGDTLSSDALQLLSQAVSDAAGEACVVYSDSDRLDADGQRFTPVFRSAWSRDLLYSTPYLGRIVCLASALFKAVSEIYPDIVEDGMSHGAMLAATQNISDAAIRHVPRVLFHLGHASGSDPVADMEAVSRATNTTVFSDGAWCRPIWPLPSPVPSVCLIIPTRDSKTLTETAVNSILSLTPYERFEILIVDNQSQDPEMLKWLQGVEHTHPRVRVVRYPHAFNYAAINNFAVTQTDADLIGLINNDVEVVHDDWLREMASHAVRPDIGCVGAKLFYSDGSVQHAGVALGIGPVAGHAFSGIPAIQPGYLNMLMMIRNVSAVTGACMIMRKDIYAEVGGMDAEHLPVTCNDVDFCLKVHAAGYRSVWTPYAGLFHHESASRGQDRSQEEKARLEKEQRHMIATWALEPNTDFYLNAQIYHWL